MTRRARDIALTTVVRPKTAPHFFVLPSMMQASISTMALPVKTDPLPALKYRLFSNSQTTSSMTFYEGSFDWRAATPFCRQWRSTTSHGNLRSGDKKSGMSSPPPCKAIAHPIPFSLCLSLLLHSLIQYIETMLVTRTVVVDLEYKTVSW